MTWEAANVRKKEENVTSHRKAPETVEAALNRLSKAYTAAMECVGSWHRADQKVTSDNKDSTLQDVGRAARNAFEYGILLDPLVVEQAPFFAKLRREMRNISLPEKPAPPLLTSRAHRATVLELSYLSLCNYADMLLSGCSSSGKARANVLDRGIIQPLSTFQNYSCWSEPEQATLRYALVALIDASHLDSSDPTLWLRLACTARRLSRTTNQPWQLRRLERHALEHGRVALPHCVPPNRLITEALEQWHSEEISMFHYISPEPKQLPPVILEIPRYSWSVVCRMILRTCREGNNNRVELYLSNMLALPQTVLARICDYLQPSDIWRFEATCRALSSSILAARVYSENQNSRQVQKNKSKEEPLRSQPLPDQEVKVSADYGEGHNQGSRASKRLRSQVITQGKRSERESRRHSLHYCFLAAIFGCTKDDQQYKRAVDTGLRLITGLSNKENISPNKAFLGRSNSNVDYYLDKEVTERLGEASIMAFIDRWSARPGGSLDLLIFFVAHVSLNVTVIFGSDPTGPVTLTLALLDAFDSVLRREDPGIMVLPSWSVQSSCKHLSRLHPIELFAVDLLQVELRFRRFDHQERPTTDFDGDVNIVASMIPFLFTQIGHLEHSASGRILTCLKGRLYWLAAMFNFWHARHPSTCISESREAERRSLEYMNALASLLTDNDLVIDTPHLESPQRIGVHWKQLSVAHVIAVRDDIQASTIVLVAQERFLEARGSLLESKASEISEAYRSSLNAIGDKLFDRYSSDPVAVGAKHSEIIDDFLKAYGKELAEFTVGGVDSDLNTWFDQLVPSKIMDKAFFLQLKSPPILTILVLCLRHTNRNIDLVNILSKILTSVSLRVSSLLELLPQSSSSADVDDDVSVDDLSLLSDNGCRANGVTDDASPLRLYSTLATMLVRLLLHVTDDVGNDENPLDYLTTTVRVSMSLISSIGSHDCEKTPYTMSQCVLLLQNIRMFHRKGNLPCSKKITEVYFLGLCEVIIVQTKRLVNDIERASNQVSSYSLDLLRISCSDLGEIVSFEPVRMNDGKLLPAPIFNGAEDILPSLCSSLMELWSEVSIQDQSTRESIRFSAAVAIIGICGSAIKSQRRLPMSLNKDNGTIDATTLVEFIDSDDSAVDWLSEGEESNKHEDLLRAVAQAAYAIAHITRSLRDTVVDFNVTSDGPLVALVSTRVTNSLSEILLLNFQSEIDENERLWTDYPVGTRKTGSILDSVLHRAYYWLHGFSLESIAQGGKISTKFSPENSTAASRLYCCIMRACSHGRKSPPKASLDTVLSALPTIKVSENAKNIWDFLSKPAEPFLQDLVAISTGRSNDWNNILSKVDWETQRRTEPVNRDLIVRLGISKLIANGPIPSYMNGGPGHDVRHATALVEVELRRKFHAIIDNLFYGDAGDCEGWYKASQCLSAKAELIADRIGLSKGYNRKSNFFVKARTGMQHQTLPLSKLIAEQEREALLRDEGWICSLGNDLSMYIDHIWSSLESLRDCATVLTQSYDGVIKELNSDHPDFFLSRIAHELDALYAAGELVAWQEAWGSLFVSSLRCMAARCMGVSLHILYKRSLDQSREDKLLISEIVETLGTSIYNELVGSQAYGYPMHVMCDGRKREIAEASLACFNRAKDLVHKAFVCEEKEDRARATWGLLFMIGKCHEKIARTYQREKLEQPAENTVKRMYEHHMTAALSAYYNSLQEALLVEREFGTLAEQNGGSAHGSTEVLYRLHGTRLKCLIAGVDKREDERELAELEALRLTEIHPFSSGETSVSSSDIRDRIWSVLSDVVSGLAQCRLDHSFFHRSVYRHAQALMWAPVMLDPVAGRVEGSLSKIPATRAFQIRGLNNATHAAESASAVISCLFDRKRSQLCSVWVSSTTNPSPFQTINNSLRKYDSLRSKYIHAYLDSLELCNRHNDLETFLRWTTSCIRDFPSYFAVSAAARGGEPLPQHMNDCLLERSRLISSYHFLTAVKRRANDALASVLVHEMRASKSNDKKIIEAHLKLAYACFLRLNCDASEFIKRKALILKNKSVVDALTMAYTKYSREPSLSGEQNDWSGQGLIAVLLETSITKCREMFPSIPINYISKKSPTKKKKKSNDTIREEPDGTFTIQKSFEVKIPPGLVAGDCFLTSILCGRETKKIRLTVPDGNPSTLRFSLRVPVEDSNEPLNKKLKTDTNLDESRQS